MSGPNSGSNDYTDSQGRDHHTSYWSEGDGITHRETYITDSKGNVLDHHYGQRDNEGTQVTYNYLTDTWEDKSK